MNFAFRYELSRESLIREGRRMLLASLAVTET